MASAGNEADGWFNRLLQFITVGNEARKIIATTTPELPSGGGTDAATALVVPPKLRADREEVVDYFGRDNILWPICLMCAELLAARARRKKSRQSRCGCAVPARVTSWARGLRRTAA